MNLTLAVQFIDNIEVTYGQAGKKWLAYLPKLIHKLSQQWDFQLESIPTDLSYHFVAFGKSPFGDAVLKMGPNGAPMMIEAQWLQAHEQKVPQVYQMDILYNAYLMERVCPGTTLKAFVREGRDREATQVIAEIIQHLKTSQPLHNQSYPHVHTHKDCLTYLDGFLEAQYIRKAQELFDHLCKNPSQDVILHGDLHHDNILRSGDDWKVIDPHGYQGPPAAEVGCMIYNPMDQFPKDKSLMETINARLNILADFLPFRREEIMGWCYCLSLRSAAWDVEGFGQPNAQTLEIGKILYNLIPC
jgi:streptomycin 6-kinase